MKQRNEQTTPGISVIDSDELLKAQAPIWPDAPFNSISKLLVDSQTKIVVLDDDPTGTQTVHDVSVLTTWDVDAIIQEFSTSNNVFYILTNSRSLSSAPAEALNREIAKNLTIAAARTRQKYIVISRSDSTLRGHYPQEVTTLIEGLDGDFDGTLLIPYFLEGGRLTIDDIHYVKQDQKLIPVAQTEFAQDAVFGFSQSNMKQWVEEKTKGAVKAESVVTLSLELIRTGGPTAVAEKLENLTNNCVCVVNAAHQRDVEVVALGAMLAEKKGKHFFYRSSSSFVQARAGITYQPLLTANDLRSNETSGILVVVGSYVPKTTNQLKVLLNQCDIQPVELEVENLLDDKSAADVVAKAALAIDKQIDQGKDAVLYTSRKLITGNSDDRNLAIGQKVSQSLIAIVHAMNCTPRYIIAKGGITSSDMATKGLDIRWALVKGQIAPGVPVWQCGPESRFPGLNYVVFPGNVGQDKTLAEVVTVLSLT
jgi:uncharacterized protein YgbK (DUF1537 family)